MTARLFDLANVVDSDDWYTPPWIFDGLGLTFDMDVAAPDGGATAVPCRRYLTVADDGLLTPWEGVVWCNPPYSDPGPWCRKWATHELGGCLMIRSDLSVAGPFVAFETADAVYVPARRVQFMFNGVLQRDGAANFSTVVLGRGEAATVAMHRLAARYGGAARRLR